MIGGICGDIVGSRFEGSTMNPNEFELFHRDCDFTDDTVCLVAVMDTLNNNSSIDNTLRNWCNNNRDRGYGGSFKRWLRDESLGPYNSYGNGAGMRIAPVSMFSASEESLLLKTDEYTNITHNHPEGIKGARAIALSCWLALQGSKKDKIKERIELSFGYNLSIPLDVLCIRDIYDESCQVTVPIALSCAFQSSSYEETVRNAVRIGGDSDTIACMSGVLAECLYGFPDSFFDETIKFLPQEMIEVIEIFYAKSIKQPQSYLSYIKSIENIRIGWLKKLIKRK